MNPNNYQYGGFYNGQQWDGTRLGPKGQIIVGGNNQASDPLAAYNNVIKEYNDNAKKYAEQQKGYYQTSHDNDLKLYNAQNQLALGTQDQNAQNAFLNSVFTPDMQRQGTAEYQYNLDSGHNNALYGLQSNYLTNNHQLALQKLAADEQNQLASIGHQQTMANLNQVDDLNRRGLLYGQHPQGVMSGGDLQGLGGFAGQLAALQNQDFATQRAPVTSAYGFGTQGENLDYNKQLGDLNENHNYQNSTYGLTAANTINNQKMGYAHDVANADNTLAMFKSQMDNQYANTVQQNKMAAQRALGSNYQ